jgi:hypothetical protein
LLDAIHAGLLPKGTAASFDGPALLWSDFEKVKVWRDLASRLYVEQRDPLILAFKSSAPLTLDDLLVMRPGMPIRASASTLDDLLTLRPRPPWQFVAAVEKRLLDLTYADDRPAPDHARQQPREQERAQREATIKALLNTGCRPGRNRDEKWPVFCQKVRERAGKEESDRGWGDPNITRTTRKLIKQNQ